MINVSKIRRGIVIDHIKAGEGIKLYHGLELENVQGVVVLMTGIPSSKMGKKDLIKIETDFDLNMDLVGLMAPSGTVNIIENGQVTNKEKICLPKHIRGVLTCKNPACVSNHQEVEEMFDLEGEDPVRYRCCYCDQVMELHHG